MDRQAVVSLLSILVVISSLVAAGGVYYLGTRPGGVSGREVVATFYPYEYLAARVAGDRFPVRALVPPGVEPHEWEPTPHDTLSIAVAPAFVYNGYVEAYLTNLFREVPGDRPLRINASAGLEVIRGEAGGPGPVDPHLWLDPVRMEAAVGTIREGLTRIDPAGASAFAANAAALREDLAMVDADYSARLQSCARRVFITQHEAFAYLAQRYGLTQYAIQGLSPDSEPTPAKLEEILRVINATGSTVVFFEELVSPAVAKTLADEAHVRTMVLSPAEGLTPEEQQAGDTYISLMERNLQNLRAALECA